MKKLKGLKIELTGKSLLPKMNETGIFLEKVCFDIEYNYIADGKEQIKCKPGMII